MMSVIQKVFRGGTLVAIASSAFGAIFLLHTEMVGMKEQMVEIGSAQVTLGNPNNPACSLRVEGSEVDVQALADTRIWDVILACEEEQRRRSAQPNIGTKNKRGVDI